MKVTYLNHSGFLAETEACSYLFDYYKGKLPSVEPGKPLLVLCSHSHPDHFNPQVFTLLKAQDRLAVTAVLSDDIPTSGIPEGIPCISLGPGETHRFPWGSEVETLRSTDLGVAFLIREPAGILYHAGDLNDWVWREESDEYNRGMTEAYRKEIDKLADISIDAAFLPLDPRQEENYDRGILYFLRHVKVNAVYPMHYWNKPDIIRRFLQEHPEYKAIVRWNGDGTQAD